MTNSVFRNISEKLFTPGSPDSLLSPENALNLRITAAFIKACVGSILPCLLNKTVTTIFSDGSEGNYRGSQNNDQLYGRGILYVGSLLKPSSVSIGSFLPLGGLKEGYSYFQDDKVTCHLGTGQHNDTLSAKWSDGFFVRGIFLPEDIKKKFSGVFNLRHVKIEDFPLPVCGGEVNLPQDGPRPAIQGTFSPNGTFTGSLNYNGNQILKKGVFSCKKSSSGTFEFEQLSGTGEGLLEDGTKTTLTMTSNFNQRSGTFKIINPKGESINEGTILGCGASEWKITAQGMGISECTFLKKKTPEGAVSVLFKEFKYSDGTVLKAQEGIDTQSSPTRFEGSIHYPNGDYKTGLFSYSDLTEDHTDYCFLSGTVRKTYPDGRVFEGTDGNVMRGVVRYPDGREEYVVA